MDLRGAEEEKDLTPGVNTNNLLCHGDHNNNGATTTNVFSSVIDKTLAGHVRGGGGAGAGTVVIPPPPDSDRVVHGGRRIGRQISYPSRSSSIRYRECLKNHAASMGTNVLDGCGEFMPSGQEGTLEALKCAACDCHRNFHRKEVAGDLNNSPILSMMHPLQNFSITAPHHHHQHQMVQPVTTVAGYGGGGTATDSSSEELNNVFVKMTHREEGEPSFMKKRHRTKFTQEQKERMLEFAEKLGWRLQKQDEEEVERFCDGLGVRRQVFKVWMHNNKNSFKKLQPLDHENHQQQQQQQPQFKVG